MAQVRKFYQEAAEQNSQAAVQHLETYVKCNPRDVEGLCYLALCYQEGKGVEKNYVRALELYEAGAELNDYLCNYNLALLYYNGLGVTRNINSASIYLFHALKIDPNDNLAFNLLKEIVEANPTAIGAITRYATCLVDSLGTAPNYALAFKHFQRAAELGSYAAKYNLASLYESGRGVKTSLTSASQWFYEAAIGNIDESMTKLRELAEKRHVARAYAHLGLCYEKGYCTAPDLNKALDHYQLAADKGDEYGMFYLAQLYEEGKGVKVNYDKAKHWYLMAAKNNYQPAAQKLLSFAEQNPQDGVLLNIVGSCYKDAWGVARDNGRAVTYYQKAHELGNLKATYNLGCAYFTGCGCKADKVKAIELFLKVALGTDKYLVNVVAARLIIAVGVDTNYALGVCYFHGLGMKQDYQQAIAHFKAVVSKDARAGYYLGLAYENGNGVSKDLYIATQHYLAAASRGDQNAFNHLQQLVLTYPTLTCAWHALAACYENGWCVQKDLSYAAHAYFQEILLKINLLETTVAPAIPDVLQEITTLYTQLFKLDIKLLAKRCMEPHIRLLIKEMFDSIKQNLAESVFTQDANLLFRLHSETAEAAQHYLRYLTLQQQITNYNYKLHAFLQTLTVSLQAWPENWLKKVPHGIQTLKDHLAQLNQTEVNTLWKIFQEVHTLMRNKNEPSIYRNPTARTFYANVLSALNQLQFAGDVIPSLAAITPPTANAPPALFFSQPLIPDVARQERDEYRSELLMRA